MRSYLHIRAVAAALGLSAATGMCQAQSPSSEELQAAIAELQTQNHALQISLAEANRNEKLASEQLAQVRLRLEALGKNLLDGGDDRLIHAAADLEISKERLTALEGAVMRLSAAVTDYLRQAVVADPDARARLETSLRELDVVLKLRQKPRAEVATGVLGKATIVSIDQQSDMLVLNLGENQGARIGMKFRLFRGQQTYGKIILADVRKAVSGAFIEHLDSPNESPRTGDIAVLLTEPE